MFSIPFTITKNDLESRYHHVHHAKSLVFLEHARLEYLKSVGHPLEALLEQGLLLVISDIKVRYRRELFEGAVSITCEEPTITGRILGLKQRILNQEGKVAVDAEVFSVFVDAKTKRSITPPAFFADVWRF